jgi:glutamate synthase domain-containing protein 2/glutamate synthase domain-containing protein 1/glutamate synthase domain-containing protein 3
VRLDGAHTHDLVEQALTTLANLDHRGATGADPLTGDGAGILTQVPDALLRDVCRVDLGLELPGTGNYAVGVVFLPQDPVQRLHCEELFVRIVAEEGHRSLGWRDVPVRSEHLGETARRSQPVVRQLFVERRTGDDEAFSRKLTVIRRRVEKAVEHSGVPSALFSVVSLSQHSMILKGLLLATQLKEYYPELSDPRYTTGLALVHSRFSTNTLGTWDLAHPFNLLAHNGEINTIRANENWLAAREPQLRSELFGGDLQKLFPIAEERWSDSAKLDGMLELLVLGGRSLEHAVAMLMPPAWTDPSLNLPDEVRAFHEFHATLVEPWDGPAAIIASDGRRVVAALDRNGLRPIRFVRTIDDLVVLASEAGVVPIEPERIVEAGRLGPGQMLVMDPQAGRLVHDNEVKRVLARRRPYREWLTEHKKFLEDLPAHETAGIEDAELVTLQRAFGYTIEELRLLLTPMARDGREPIGSMGDDTPLAALSERPKLIAAYFKQHFAQVTNPPIDPQREHLVMSLRTSVGAIGNLLGERPEDCRRVDIPTPVLQNDGLERVRHLHRDGFEAATLSTLYRISEGADGLARAVDSLCRRASQLVWDGVTILILSDRGVDGGHAAIPPLLATAAVHSHLVREGARTLCGLVVESAEPRETMHVALLLGYGAAAVNPYLALESVDSLQAVGDVGPDISSDEARQHYVDALSHGILKVCSRMGISTVQSYRGAQIFEAVGLGRNITDRYFPGTVSRVGGLELPDLHVAIAERHDLAFQNHALVQAELDPGGEYQLRRRGEHHAWNADTVVFLQRAVREEDHESFAAFARAIDAPTAKLNNVRGLLEFVPSGDPLPLDDIETSDSILKRFATGAMSLGSLSPEAHEAIAIAANRIGARSNTGEGGEDPQRSRPDANGDLRRSAIKQVASGRFGVTTQYLVDADQLQIKIAQGAKPGEGGQIPGHKVDERIARLRHAMPGVGLISPPPHHDIYSIEDLAQLIHDLKCVNPKAAVSVKLVSEAGVGTIAAGVAKARAEHIVIAGHDGGTGASPLSSLKYVGLPWEIGLAESHQVLVQNELRGRVRLQVDGGLRTGRDVVIAALLGADEFAFGTAPLVAMGCVMMRVCHLNTCPVGIATQDPELRELFSGTPDHVVRYLVFVAEQVREIMATLNVRHFDELVGRTDLLRPAPIDRWPWLRDLDLTPLLFEAGPSPYDGTGETTRIKRETQNHHLERKLIERDVIAAARPAIEHLKPVSVARRVETADRSFGAMLAGEICRRAGTEGLPDGAITMHLTGTGGQSFGAFAVRGMTLDLVGVTNDYAGKGLSGGRIIVRPPAVSRYLAEEHVVAGNVVLYGATSGEAFFRGRAGERFAVRNSGATAVVEGVGDHACEYMTGGTVVVLGPTGRNFAAGMSGGVAYVLDSDKRFADRCNKELVDIESLGPLDAETLHVLLVRHAELTGSAVARRLLGEWPHAVSHFRLVMPHDFRRFEAERHRIRQSEIDSIRAFESGLEPMLPPAPPLESAE